jgi:pimeloyl-ACP methyl ester carboxylesterase
VIALDTYDYVDGGAGGAARASPLDVGVEPHVVYSVHRQHESWARARAQYPRIRLPVHLVYGIGDWSRATERSPNARAISTARLTILRGVGHFSSLEKPALIAEIILAERTSATLAGTCP